MTMKRRGETNMSIKTVKVSEKGQIAIPRSIREKIGIKKGDELIMLQEDEKILLQKIQATTKKVRREFDFLVKLSEGVATKLWSNKEDETWDKL